MRKYVRSASHDVSVSLRRGVLAPHRAPRTARDAATATLSFDVKVTPKPVERLERADFFGNTTNWFTIDEPHAEVGHSRGEPGGRRADAGVRRRSRAESWETVRSDLRVLRPIRQRSTRCSTPSTRRSRRQARTWSRTRSELSSPGGRCSLACSTSTRASTPTSPTTKRRRTHEPTVERVFELRAGVCQDLAHVGSGRCPLDGTSRSLRERLPVDAAAGGPRASRSGPTRATLGSRPGSRPSGGSISIRRTTCCRAANTSRSRGGATMATSPRSTASSPAAANTTSRSQST